jgi:hypothetical protein
MSTARKIVASSLAAAAIGCPCLALAQDTFRTEAGLYFSRAKSDAARIDATGAQATYFFDGVPTGTGDYPLDQAQFVERIGGVSANYGRSSLHVEGFDTLSKGSTYGAVLDLRQAETPLVVTAGYGFSRSGKLGSSNFETQSDTKSYRLSIGAYIDKATAYSLDWSRSKTEADTSGTSPSADFHDTMTSIGISRVQLERLAEGGYIAFLASVSRRTNEQEGSASEENRSILLQATYYPTKRLGLNFGVLTDRGDDISFEGEIYLTGVKMFVTPTVSLGLDYERFLAKTSDGDSRFLVLRGAVRF